MEDIVHSFKEVIKGLAKWLAGELTTLWTKVKKFFHGKADAVKYRALSQLSIADQLKLFDASVSRALKVAKGQSQ